VPVEQDLVPHYQERDIKNAIGAMGVFLLFGSLTLVALLYFWREVPETKGRSMQEIERDLVGRAVG
jgi:hypothetical protein